MKQLPFWKQLPQMFFDLLFPLHCVGCGKAGYSLCEDCIPFLPRLEGDLCPRCSRPLGARSVCQPCRIWPLTIEIHAPFQFQGVIREAVHGLKYGNNRSLATPLAELLFSYWQSHTLFGDVLVPVPLHRSKLRARGYNQSELLAKGLAKRVGLPVVTSALVRRRNMIPQVRTANIGERWANAAGAFECRSLTLQGKRVVLLDDVCTTGATLDAAARSIVSAGANSVWGLTVAREV